MLDRYIIFKTKQNILTPFFKDFLKGFLGASIKIKEDTDIITVYYSLDEDIKEGIMGLIAELDLNVVAYISSKCSNKEELEINYDVISNYIINTDLEKNIYDEHELLTELVLNGYTKGLDRVVFKSLYNDTQMLEAVKSYLENDMNVLKASNRIYMHRNTLTNKLLKFINVTNYDVKKFKDSFIIYHLLKK